MGFDSKIRSIIASNYFEVICLVIFIILLFLVIRPFTEDKLLVHDSPYKFVAGDMFWIAGYAEGIKETGSASMMPSYLAQGEKDIAMFRPPVAPVTWASLSILSGIEVYDVEFNSNLFFAIMFIALLYLILRKVSVHLAIFSLPLAFLLFIFPFNYFITWGMQMSNFNFFFVLLSVLSLFFIRERFFVPLFAVLMAGGLYSHMRETIMLWVCLGFYVIFMLITKHKDWLADLKSIIKGSVLAGILFLPYVPFIRQLPEGTKFHIIKWGVLSQSSSSVLVSDIGLWNILVAIGAVFFIILLLQKKLSKDMIVAYSFSAGFVFSSFFTMFGNKVTQIRHFFPLMLAPFAGLAVMQAHNIIKKKFLVILYSVITAAIILAFFFPKPIPDYAVSNPYTYDSFRYVWANTLDDSNFIVLYGDNFYQETLFYFLKREADLLETAKISELVKNNTIQLDNIPISTMAYPISIKRTGIFSFETISKERNRNVSVCDYDFVLLNHRSQNQQLENLNKAIIGNLVQLKNFSVFYTNDLTAILKNNGCKK